jgi:hypothetical protein
MVSRSSICIHNYTFIPLSNYLKGERMDLLVTYWQFTLVGIFIIIAYILTLVMAERHSHIWFKVEKMPTMKPISIPTKNKGFWAGVWTWLMVTRTWEITKDYKYSINGEDLVIPAGFIFDGASVPKFFRSWLSPMGVLLIGGLVHDYGYKYQTLLKSEKKNCNGLKTQKEMDTIFRDINIEVNGFRVINYLAYYALRLGGFMAWRGHRKVGADWKSSFK